MCVTLRGMLDETQRKALDSALSINFSVIQGPPGTGKTHASAIIILYFMLRNMFAQDLRASKDAKKFTLIKPPRVLIWADSNQ